MFQIIDASHKSQCPDSSVPKCTYSFNKKLWYKGITKTMQLWVISLAWASVLKGCFLLEIYSLTILFQFLILKINSCKRVL